MARGLEAGRPFGEVRRVLRLARDESYRRRRLHWAVSLLAEATRRAISRGEGWLDVTGLLLAALADPGGGARRVLVALGVDVSAVRARLERDTVQWQPETRMVARTRRSDVG